MTSFNERLRAAMLSDAEAAENKRLRAAPATAPEFPADWAQMIHYPECWDTAAYPELRDAIHEALAWSGCSVCKPSTAPDEQLRKDSERYRWLRSQHWSDGQLSVVVNAKASVRLGANCPSHELLDEAIDAAMKETP